MADYLKHESGKYTLFLIPIKEDDNKTIYLDFTRVAKPALKEDRKHEYKEELGPDFGFSVYHALQYAEYLRDECNLNVRNFQRFGTNKGYSLFVEEL
jgi:hypothetical protein